MGQPDTIVVVKKINRKGAEGAKKKPPCFLRLCGEKTTKKTTGNPCVGEMSGKVLSKIL